MLQDELRDQFRGTQRCTKMTFEINQDDLRDESRGTQRRIEMNSEMIRDSNQLLSQFAHVEMTAHLLQIWSARVSAAHVPNDGGMVKVDATMG